MQIGFTGSRSGMSSHQKKGVKSFLRAKLKHITGVRHGDCVWADEQFHKICLKLKIPITIHPPDDDSLRAFCRGYSRILKVKPYLERDRDIVDRCDIFLATPREDTNQIRSGTWYTVRYAKKQKKQVFIIFRDGHQVEVNLKYKGDE